MCASGNCLRQLSGMRIYPHCPYSSCTGHSIPPVTLSCFDAQALRPVPDERGRYRRVLGFATYFVRSCSDLPPASPPFKSPTLYCRNGSRAALHPWARIRFSLERNCKKLILAASEWLAPQRPFRRINLILKFSWKTD